MVKSKSEAGWKPVKIDCSLYAAEGFDSLVSFEELTDYQIIDGKIVTNEHVCMSCISRCDSVNGSSNGICDNTMLKK